MSGSIAGRDYRAVNFLQQNGSNSVFIPLSTFSWDNNQANSGMLELKVDFNSGFQEVGRVSHFDIAENKYCNNIPADDTTRLDNCGDNTQLTWLSTPKRTITMSQNEKTYVYTISDIGIKVTALENPDIALGQGLLPR